MGLLQLLMSLPVPVILVIVICLFLLALLLLICIFFVSTATERIVRILEALQGFYYVNPERRSQHRNRRFIKR